MCFFLSDIKGTWHRVFKTVFYSVHSLLCTDIAIVSKMHPCHAAFLLFQICNFDLHPFLICLPGPITSFPYSILVFAMPRQKVRTSTKRVSQICTSKHPPGLSRRPHSTHAAMHCCWVLFAGTWGKRLLQSCAETWDLAVVYVPHEVRNVTGLCIRLGAFISYGSFLLSDIQGGTHLSKLKFLQLGWSSCSPCISKKEMSTSRVHMASWLKNWFSPWLINALCTVNLATCTADM